MATTTTNYNLIRNEVSDDSLAAWVSNQNTTMNIIDATMKGLENIIGTATITTTGWTSHTGDNPWKFNLPITGVTTSSWVDLTIDANSQDIALDAGINPTILEYNGGVTIYANAIPTAQIPVRYKVVKNG